MASRDDFDIQDDDALAVVKKKDYDELKKTLETGIADLKASFEKANQELRDIIADLSKRLGETGSMSPKSSSEDDTIIIEKYKKAYKITGNSKKYKELLKNSGCAWNASLKAWIFRGADKDKIISILTEEDADFIVKE